MTDRSSEPRREWYRVAGLDDLPEGRVRAVTCGLTTICLSHLSEDTWDHHAPAWRARKPVLYRPIHGWFNFVW